MTDMTDINLRLGQALLWVLGYVGVLLACVLVDVALWRKVLPGAAPWLDAAASGLMSLGFLLLLERAGLRPRLLANLSGRGLLLALGCALLLFLLLDKGLDPLLDRLFPKSGRDYGESVAALKASPGPALARVCLVAPVMEETLTRGLLLGGLRQSCGLPLALGLSVGVFALLHFNLVQTLSAAACGLALAGLYLHTGSLGCCVLAHAAYNLLSFLALLRASG